MVTNQYFGHHTCHTGAWESKQLDLASVWPSVPRIHRPANTPFARTIMNAPGHTQSGRNRGGRTARQGQEDRCRDGDSVDRDDCRPRAPPSSVTRSDSGKRPPAAKCRLRRSRGYELTRPRRTWSTCTGCCSCPRRSPCTVRWGS